MWRCGGSILEDSPDPQDNIKVVHVLGIGHHTVVEEQSREEDRRGRQKREMFFPHFHNACFPRGITVPAL